MSSRRRMRTAALLSATSLVVGGLVSAPGAAAAAACAPAAAGGDWRAPGQDLANTRSQPLETTLGPAQAATLEPAWTFQSSDVAGARASEFTNTPVVADGCVFVGSGAGEVFALNADSGQLVWFTKLPGGGVRSSLTVDGGRVYAAVSQVGDGANAGPYAVALDQMTGAILWQTRYDRQLGSVTTASPVVHRGVVLVGWSDGAAGGGVFQGGFALLDALTGDLLKTTYTVRAPDADPAAPKDQLGGGGVSSTPGVDTVTGTAYVVTGAPHQAAAAHPQTNAVVKVDLNRGSVLNPNPAFGTIVGSYGGNPAEQAASPNLWYQASELHIGVGQRSGVYQVGKASTMQPVWTGAASAPIPNSSIGSSALDGTSVIGPAVGAGHLFSISRTGDELNAAGGSLEWVAPAAADPASPVSVANFVAYAVDVKGVLAAYDASTGAPLLHLPLLPGTGDTPAVPATGAVAIARNTVYAAAGSSGSGDGAVIALRPNSAVPPIPDPGPLPGPGDPPAGSHIVSVLQAQFYGYASPFFVVTKGGQLTYTNLDAVGVHDVVHDVAEDALKRVGSSDRPWCNRYRPGQCPVFWSKLISAGGQTPVLGTDQLVASAPDKAVAEAYPFYCTLHPSMKGQLVVLPS